MRLDIRRKEIIKGKAGADDEGVRVKCKVAKNKVAPPYKVAEFDMIFGMGISGLGCMLDAADEMGVIERRGSWYSYGEERLGQGREKAMEYMTENPHVLESVEADVRRVIAEKLAGKYGAPIDKQAKEVAPLGAFGKARRSTSTTRTSPGWGSASSGWTTRTKRWRGPRASSKRRSGRTAEEDEGRARDYARGNRFVAASTAKNEKNSVCLSVLSVCLETIWTFFNR